MRPSYHSQNGAGNRLCSLNGYLGKTPEPCPAFSSWSPSCQAPQLCKTTKPSINTGETNSQNLACYISELATIKSALKTHNSTLNRTQRQPRPDPLRSIALC